MTTTDDAQTRAVTATDLTIPKARRLASSTVPLPAADTARPAATPAERRGPSALDILVAVGLTSLILLVISTNTAGFPSASDDEGTYLSQAWAVQHGLGLAHYTYWYDHPPLGWIQLAGLSWWPALLAPGLLAVAAGRIAMLPVIAVSLLLVYVIGRRLTLPRWASALALLVYGLSPLAVTMNRQIYLDSFAVAWLLGALSLALSPRKHLWHYAAAGASTAIAVLSKETMLLAAPAVLLAIWQNGSRTTTRPWALGGFTSGLVLCGVFYPLYALLRGELFPGAGHVSLIGAWQFQLASRSGSGSIFDSGSNSSSLLHSWLYYDSVILVVGLVATVLALAVPRLRPPAVAGAVLTLVALRPNGYLPAMYVVQVLPFFALAVGGVVAEGVRRLEPRRHVWRRVVAGVVAATALAVVAPGWYAGDRRAVVVDVNGPYRAAARFLRTSVPDLRHAKVVVDDVLWLDCVNAGYPSDNVLWFYKLDLDPAVAARLPHGWRDVDYLVSTPALRQDPDSLPTVATLLRNSTVIASYGSDAGRVEIRRVDKEK